MELFSILMRFKMLLLIASPNESNLEVKKTLEIKCGIPIININCSRLHQSNDFYQNVLKNYWPENTFATLQKSKFMCQNVYNNGCKNLESRLFFIASNMYDVVLFLQSSDYGLIRFRKKEMYLNKTDENITLRDCQNNTMECGKDIQTCVARMMLTVSKNNVLRGYHFTVGSNELQPYMRLVKTTDGKIISSSGIDASLLETLAQHFQFTYEQVSAKDNEWGVKKNGTWSGMVGMVYRKEADFALSGIAINDMRIEAIRYSFPHLFTENIFVVAAQKPQPNPFAFLQAVTADVWGMGFFSMLSVALILYAKMKTNFIDIIFKLYSNLIGKDLPMPGATDASVKLILAFWMIFSLFLNAIFSGVLTSNVIPVTGPVVETLSGLRQAVLKKELIVGTTKGNIYHQLLAQAKDGLYYDLGEMVRTNPDKALVSGDLTGLERVLKEKYVFIGIRSSLEAMTQQFGATNFHFSRESFFTTPVAIIFSKDCWYADNFDHAILRTIETGLIDKWTATELTRRKSTKQNIHDNKQTLIFALKLEDVLIPVYTLGLGLLMSTLTFIIEYAFKYKMKK